MRDTFALLPVLRGAKRRSRILRILCLFDVTLDPSGPSMANDDVNGPKGPEWLGAS